MTITPVGHPGLVFGLPSPPLRSGHRRIDTPHRHPADLDRERPLVLLAGPGDGEVVHPDPAPAPFAVEHGQGDEIQSAVTSPLRTAGQPMTEDGDTDMAIE